VVYRHSDPKRCPRTEARPGAWQGSKPHARSPYPDAGNLFHRTLKPAAQEAGAAWAGFHAFRHYCASALIADGRNIVQVSRWLGHHSPSFTLDVYAHLMDDGVGRRSSCGPSAPLTTRVRVSLGPLRAMAQAICSSTTEPARHAGRRSRG
jgi:hypothetical protein